ncbi:hypothetical protein [Brachybacterium fresconis]|uniref:Transmembrane protein n=1 Tax=Brachybacterium fresconis TaxID=173363 RepID=A0ABS4YM71_9MICO|nr:hypothetical protein [Brachybacterium fresconis]MBP2409893.1 hypothetical protein [Brachybacterium fresconis]
MAPRYWVEELITLEGQPHRTVHRRAGRGFMAGVIFTAVACIAGSLWGRRMGLRAKKVQDAFDRKIRGQSDRSSDTPCDTP